MDYAHAIVEHFVVLRGKGSAVSSADEGLLLGWEDEGIPLDIVLEGIDLAFEKKRDAPRSLQQCGRWVKKLYKQWTDEAVGSGPEQTIAASRSGGASSSQLLPGLSDKQRAALLRWRKHTFAPLRDAAEAMWADLQAQAEADGVITDEVASIVEDAVRMMAEENGASADALAAAMR